MMGTGAEYCEVGPTALPAPALKCVPMDKQPPCRTAAEPTADAGVRAIIGCIPHLPVRLPADISIDAAQTMQVLQIANSAFLRRADRVGSLEQAVQHLGLGTVRSLVVCTEVGSRWPEGMRHPAVDLEDLQDHALRTAAVTWALTREMDCSADAVLAALLHDIGYRVLIQERPRELEQAVELAHAAGIALSQAEEEILGVSHAQIGAHLLALWGLPAAVVDAVACHHRHDSRRTGALDATSALAVAMALAGGDDADGCARNLVPSPVVDARFLAGLDSDLTWECAQQRAQALLTGIAQDSN
jgi:putative nucleotidyltransferase with HDIG domain